ncbi:testis-specific serine/threonine-protein kinase 4-like [Ciconia maguari]
MAEVPPDPNTVLVAIKVISKRKALEEDLRKFLPHQMQVLKGLCHKHLITLHGEEDGLLPPHRVGPLGERPGVGAEPGALLPGPAGLWFSQLLLALAYLHSRAIIHQWGLEAGKPSPGQQGQGEGLHLQLLQDGGPAGCQWVLGASRHARLPAKAALSQTFCGSYAYACPEILQAQPYDPFLADTWSASVILHALLLGCMPWDATNLQHLLRETQRPPAFP